MRTINQTGQLLAQIPPDPAMHRRTGHPDRGRDLHNCRTGKNRANRANRCSTSDKTTSANTGLPEPGLPAEKP